MIVLRENRMTVVARIEGPIGICTFKYSLSETHRVHIKCKGGIYSFGYISVNHYDLLMPRCKGLVYNSDHTQRPKVIMVCSQNVTF